MPAVGFIVIHQRVVAEQARRPGVLTVTQVPQQVPHAFALAAVTGQIDVGEDAPQFILQAAKLRAMGAEGKRAHQAQDEIAVFLAREHLQDARALGHEIDERGAIFGRRHRFSGGHAESGMYPLTLSFSTLMSAARMMPSAYSLPAVTISVRPIRRKPGDSDRKSVV